MRPNSIPFRLLLTACLVLPSLALATGDQTGQIQGVVTDVGGKTPLPQVRVEISSPALIGGAQVRLSKDDGTFQFRELLPGQYTAKIGLDGFKSIERQVVVQLGTITPLLVEYSPEAAEAAAAQPMGETIEVVGQNQMNAGSTQSGSVLNANAEAKVASARTYQNVTQQVAGVTITNGGQNPNPNIMGGSALMNRYLIDGLDVTDPVTNGFSSNVNFDSIQSIQVLTGGMDAQYNAMGGVINLVTNGGSDEFHADTSVYYNNAKLSASNNVGRGLTEGFRPFDTHDLPPTQGIQANISISGPLVKQRLWYSLGFQYQRNESSQPLGPPLNIQAPSRVFLSYLPRAKLTFAPVDSQRFTFSFFADPTTIDFRDNALPAANQRTPDASRRQNQGGYSAVLAWDNFITSSLSTKLTLGYQLSEIDVGPQAKLGAIDFGLFKGKLADDNLTYDYNRPGHFNSDDSTFWYNPNFNTTDRRTTINGEAQVVYVFQGAGEHEAQAGVQFRQAVRAFSTAIPGGSYYTDLGGGDLEAGLCNEATGNGCYLRQDTPFYAGVEHGYSLGFYAQDRWRPFPWLTLLPGLRFDYGTTTNGANQLVSNLAGFGPRIGAVWDITHDNKTIFSAFYGRSNEVLSLLAASNSTPGVATTNYLWNQSTKSFVFDSTQGGPGSIQLDPNHLTPPHADQIQLGVRRLVFNKLTTGVQYTWKRISNIWDTIEVNQIFDPSGTRVVGYRNGQPTSVGLLTTPNLNYNIYQGVDLSLQGNPTKELNVYAAYTLAFKYGPGSDELGQLGLRSQFANPYQTQMFTGWAFGDIRHSVKVNGSYSFYGFSIGPNIVWTSGDVRAATYLVYDPNVNNIQRSPVGTQPGRPPTGTPNSQASITEFRTPPLLTVDVRATYTFPKFAGLGLSLIADVFNALNLGGATDVVSTENTATFGTAAAIQQPLRVQLAARLTY